MKRNFSLLIGAIVLAPTSVAAQSPSDINPACLANATKPVAPGTNQTPNYIIENPNAPQSPYPDFGFMVTEAEYFECWSDQPIF